MPQVTTVCRDHERGWWIGTLTDGIYYRSTPAPWITNVPLTGIRTASRAGKNLLVLGSERDLLLFDTQQRRVVRTLKAGCGKCFDAMSDEHGKAAGMPETLMCERAAAVMPDGKVWMASTEGLVCIEPELLEKSAKGYASKVLLLDSHCPSATLPGL